VRFGSPRRHFRVCDSTNDRARELAAAGAPGGTIVTAGEQQQGRGRQGRSWTARPGAALLYSGLLRPLAADDQLLPLAVPLAVAEAIEDLAAVRCAVKWPNDIWIDGRKCAGVLIEARPREGWAVIGIGLNVSIAEEEFPPELRQTATSIGNGVAVEEALSAVNEQLSQWVDADQTRVREQFARRDGLAGRQIAWEDGEGIAQGIDERGNLLVETASGRVALGAGEVHLAVSRAG
jgi:BirA family transcriptional regulator, biotin operon repressor / biotin---[acetyl-CoA-carboxylase] ligase